MMVLPQALLPRSRLSIRAPRPAQKFSAFFTPSLFARETILFHSHHNVARSVSKSR